MGAHAFVAFLILRFLFPRATPARRRRLVGWWSGRLMRILNVRTLVTGALPVAGVPTLIVANHVSWLDIFLISSVEPTRFIARSEIRDWPLAGWIVEKAGTLFIRRAGRRDLARINERAHAALAAGDCVGLFPEGGTSEGDRLQKFHSSLFEPALAIEARVYPVAIRYEHADGSLCRAASFYGEISFMQSLALIVRQREIVSRIAFAPAIETAGMERREVSRIAEGRIATLLGLDAAGRQPGTTRDPPGAPP
jgi:1-acyl-sn-glycerol-3-phosphate acyltransferase